MSEWYYSHGGQQNGPVSFEKLTELARSGGLDPVKDLVWNSSMKDWTPSGKVDGLFNETPADPSNPYAAPQSAWNEPSAPTGEPLPEIIPGSDPIDVMGCVKRDFELTKRNFATLLLVVLVFSGISIAAAFALGALDAALGLAPNVQSEFNMGDGGAVATFEQRGSPLNMILSKALSTFLSLGAIRIGLNAVSGKPFSVGMLFGGGRHFLRAFGASILFSVMVLLGIICLIVPGIYLALRYGQYMPAIVDKDMGIMEAFSYSSSITTNNRLNLFLLALMAIVIALAGLLALCVGLLFAYPVIGLSWIVAYRWMQHGHRAAMDQPGTQTPMLAGR